MKKTLYILVFLFSLFIINSSVKAWSEYTIGQEVEYNEIEFYVIKNSDTKEDNVTLLKKEPLTVDEINLYSGETGATTNNDGGVQYHLNSSNYETSFVKVIVDNWSSSEISEGFQGARLITLDELKNNLGYVLDESESFEKYIPSSDTPLWVYNSSYWTMTSFEDSSSRVWYVINDGRLVNYAVNINSNMVRPVVLLKKSVLGDIDDSKQEEVIPNKQDNNKQESIIKVNVANTYLKRTIIVIIMGFIIAGISVFIYYKVSNKKK